jgi:hypothetical protein
MRLELVIAISLNLEVMKRSKKIESKGKGKQVIMFPYL